MKLSRRGFFGSLPAMPSLADVAVKTATEMAGEVYMNSSIKGGPTPGKYADKVASEESLESKLNRLNNLKRVASGDVREEDMRHCVEYYGDSCAAPYEEIKSVSVRGKYAMRLQLAERRTKQDLIRQAKEALLHYDSTGFLRYLI